MRPRAVLVALAVVAVVAAVAVPYLPGSPLARYSVGRLLGAGDDPARWGDPAAATGVATQPPPAAADLAQSGPLLTAGPVNVPSPGFWSWALLDTRTGELTGSPNLAAPSDTASMSKAWIAADYLRRAAEKSTAPGNDVMRRLSALIRDSDNTHAFSFHVSNGNLASITRMTKLCGLTDTTGVRNSWSLTRMSARDVTRLGACIADGRAAGPKWTGWLLAEMRAIRGPGRFGVIEVAPPAAQVAVKNGWLLREDGQWHIACLGIGDGWTLGVMVRHPGRLGRDHGTRICRSVAEQLMSR